ncbi:MAG TPA: DinB family protein [Planctomycetota bacterium]|nr:DinB family protein [Planctomycetota bacterium]
MIPLLEELHRELETDRARIESALARLEPTDIWRRPRPSMSSIGNLCLHLAGNESHYIGRLIGKTSYVRRRSEEFTTENGPGREGLIEKLREARATTTRAFESLREDDLGRTVESDHPQDPTVLRTIIHVIEHYGYHTGQIVLLTRLFQASDERLLEWGH